MTAHQFFDPSLTFTGRNKFSRMRCDPSRSPTLVNTSRPISKTYRDSARICAGRHSRVSLLLHPFSHHRPPARHDAAGDGHECSSKKMEPR
ncbi:hypothetical protein Bcep1808_4936 [Burkholderia vietnamiensis G4]|uniref:Uncharacterized protein n=1 Tax=Burkholderia vietnamiensis (strain G4 / LMG 22486) TaxID=269482 RepID=A4JNP0_BURVG|nr:hypothetical protein Bcep1808_4936 [Burkholderia vietnamiensis G4]